MSNKLHTFHIPVMGTGHSVDTPIRVAPFGINSVISIIDDLLVEKVRRFYAKQFSLPYTPIPKKEHDGRAKRITAYLNLVKDVVDIKLEAIRQQPFFQNNDKTKYFEMLPDSSTLRQMYDKLLSMTPGHERESFEQDLTAQMEAGSIDVNIMVKVDLLGETVDGIKLDETFSDAKSALRGFANSKLKANIVFSAGINQSLYAYMTQFKDFYRDRSGEIRKKIILKVSDFRSTMIQGKFLAKKGLEVFEFRIESGLNCGGHAFASNGYLLPTILKEFRDKRDELSELFEPLIRKYYSKIEKSFFGEKIMDSLITVQGGIGTIGETMRLHKDFGMDLTGWASPFLLVPEATPIDESTRELIKNAGEDDLFLSDASPLGVPFNNIKNTGSQIWTKGRMNTKKPGSSCPRGFLKSNTDFTEKPICTASSEYQILKLEQIDNSDMSEEKKAQEIAEVHKKECLCVHLGNGVLINLGILDVDRGPQAICPGSNVAWFNRYYTLREMVDHIYGRGKSLVSETRPHMFAHELKMYVDYFESMTKKAIYDLKEAKRFKSYFENMQNGIDYCLEIAQSKPYHLENLASLAEMASVQRKKLETLWDDFLAELQRRDIALS